MVEHEIVTLPSISVIAALRAELRARKTVSKGVAVFADPVFDRDDERFKLRDQHAGIAKSADDSSRADVRGVFDRNGGLGRLKNSRAEAEAIRSLSPDAVVALDFDATSERAKAPSLADFGVIHFATHGLLDTTRPDLSSIALSMIDAQGGNQDGFLSLKDIYNMRLKADLVVLSACRTALGKDIRGEGLVGLTRGFMYAGAARVMASLWNVDDRRTGRLMSRFYRGVLKENLQPAAALRAAQLEMWQSKDDSPFFWGAFVLQGEWRSPSPVTTDKE